MFKHRNQSEDPLEVIGECFNTHQFNYFCGMVRNVMSEVNLKITDAEEFGERSEHFIFKKMKKCGLSFRQAVSSLSNFLRSGLCVDDILPPKQNPSILEKESEDAYKLSLIGISWKEEQWDKNDKLDFQSEYSLKNMIVKRIPSKYEENFSKKEMEKEDQLVLLLIKLAEYEKNMIEENDKFKKRSCKGRITKLKSQIDNLMGKNY